MTALPNPMNILGKTKDTLREMFLDDPIISSLVMPQPDDPDFSALQNWLGGTYSGTTLTGHCFDVSFIPSGVTDDRAFLCMETNILSAGNAVHTLALTVKCFASDAKLALTEQEKDIFIKDYGFSGNRVDIMSEAIYHFFLTHPEVCRALSIGNITLASEKNPTESLRVDNKYYGRAITFELRGFNLTPRTKRQAGR